MVAADPNVPRSYHHAIRFPDADDWMQAMREEIRSHKEMGTWRLVPRDQVPSGAKIIGSNWTFTRKLNAEGKVQRYKARGYAQGFAQRGGIEFNPTERSTKTIRMKTLRLLMAAQHPKWLPMSK